MAKKNMNPLEDPPAASSSDEEELETLSGEEEEVEEQISDDSSSEEDEPKNHPAATKQGSDSDSGSETETEPPPNPSKSRSKKPAVAVAVAKPKPAVKSTSKRRSEKTSEEANAKRAKAVSEDAKKPLFHRLWSEEDEISLLQGMIDFKADTGDSPYEDMEGFYEIAVKSISFDASRSQFMDKIRALKKKFMKKVAKGAESSLERAHDKECMKLAKYIWGSDGMALKSNVKKSEKKSKKTIDSLKPHVEEDKEVLVNGNRVEVDKEVLVNGKKVEEEEEEEEEEDKEVLVRGDSKSLDWFQDSFLVRSIAGLGVDEHFVKQRWSKVSVETKKRIEEKWKLLQAKEMETVRQKTEFLNEVASVIAETS